MLNTNVVYVDLNGKWEPVQLHHMHTTVASIYTNTNSILQFILIALNKSVFLLMAFQNKV